MDLLMAQVTASARLGLYHAVRIVRHLSGRLSRLGFKPYGWVDQTSGALAFLVS